MLTRLFILFSLFSLSFSCRQSHQKAYPTISRKETKEPLINENKRLVREESLEIDQYAKRHNWEMLKTGTGLRYMIYENGNGEKAATGKIAKINFEVSLLDGTICYSSSKLGSKEFLIGQSDVESGLHEGILLMKIGDKAKFILPPHLAHGLIGDTDKIPANSTIVYDVELLGLK